MELEQVKQQTTWNDASESINSNFAKVDIEIEKLKNVTTRDKGYYQTVEALVAAHPTASVGSRAFVGYVAPYAVYVWDKATSKWVDTGETITDATLDLGDYYTKADVDNLVLAINRALGTKFGALYVDATTGLMSAFATEADKQEWLETGNANLVLTQVNVGGGGGGGGTGTTSYQLSLKSNVDTTKTFSTTDTNAYVNFYFIAKQKAPDSDLWEEMSGESISYTIEVATGGSAFTQVTQGYLLAGASARFDVRRFLVAGSSTLIRIRATGDLTGLTATLTYNYSLTSMAIAPANFTWYTPFIQGSNYALGGLTITGNLEKTLYVKVSSSTLSYTKVYTKALGTQTWTTTPFSYTEMKFPTTGTGVYAVEIWLDADGLESEHLKYNIMCVSSADQYSARLVTMTNVASEAVNYADNKLFSYAIYNKGGATGDPTIVLTKTEGGSTSTFYSDTLEGVTTAAAHDFTTSIEIASSSSDVSIGARLTYGNEQTATFVLDNSASFPATSGTTFYMNPASRSNSQTNYLKVVNEATSTAVTASWTNMAWADGTDGWTIDGDGRKCLRLPATTKCTVTGLTPMSSFGTAKTLEFTFKAENAADYNEPIITICDSPTSSGFRGIKILPDKIIVHSRDKQNDLVQSYPFQDEKAIHLVVTIQKNYNVTYGNLCKIYANGVGICSFAFTGTDNWTNDGYLIMGSNTADLYVYGFRQYESGFGSADAFRNFLASLPDLETKREENADYYKVLNDGEQIDYDVIKDTENTMVIEMLNGAELPQYGFDKEYEAQCNMWLNIFNEIDGIDPVGRKLTGAYLNQPITGQGTTSMNYYRWNLRWKMDDDYDIRITAKKNYASSMQSHKMGATALYNDVYEALGLSNGSTGRVAVYQYPVYGFLKKLKEGTTNQYYYEFIGLFTVGPDKGDKKTFGFKDSGLKDTVINLEGTDHNPAGVGFDYPWSQLKYIADNEAFGAALADGTYEKAYEVGNCGKAETEAEIQAYLNQEFAPAYNVVFENSTMIIGTTTPLSTINANVTTWGLNKDADGHLYSRYMVWIDGDYTLYYLNKATNKYTSTGINLKTQNGTPSGSTIEAKNEWFKTQRRVRFKANMENYWDLEDLLFHDVFLLIIAASDNLKKNFYPQKFAKLADGGRWGFRQDDLDSILRTDNQAHQTKGYSVEQFDWTDDNKTAYVFKGEDSALHHLLYECYPDEVRQMGYRILDAMASLSDTGTNAIDKLMGCFEKYFFGKAQDYFTKSAYNADAVYSYEDAWPPYNSGEYSVDVHPLEQSLGGNEESERGWLWLRMIYCMSMFRFGTFVTYTDTSLGRITYRPQYAQSFTLTPAIDLYPTILPGQGTGVRSSERIKAGESITLPAIGGGNTNVYIPASDYIRDIGDLRTLAVDSAAGAMSVAGKRLQKLKLGDSNASTVTSTLTGLTIGSCPSLTEIDARNVAGLTETIDLTNCPRIEKAYFGGTDVKGVVVPSGAKITTLQLGDSTTTITLVNLPRLTSSGFTYGTLANVEYLRVEKTGFDEFKVLRDLYNLDGSVLRDIRIMGVNTSGTATDIDMLANLYNDFDKDGNPHSYNGIDAEGNADEDLAPVVEGTLRIAGSVYEDTYQVVSDYFKNLNIIVSGGRYIRFVDPEVLAVLLANNVGDGTGITVDDAEEVTTINYFFPNNTEIVSFNEFEYFTGVTMLGVKSGTAKTGFNGCVNLMFIKLPTSLTMIGRDVFANVPAGQYDLSNITEIYDGAFGASGIKDVYAPKLTVIGQNVFRNCLSLETVRSLGSITNTPSTSGAYGLFYKCTSLKSVVLPETLTTIGGNTFSECVALDSINIPLGVVTLGTGAFYKCTSLSFDELNLPNLTSLGQNAFYGVKIRKLNLGKVTTWPTANSSTQNYGDKSVLEELIFSDEVTNIPQYFLSGYSKVAEVNLENVTTLASNALRASGLVRAVLPNLTTLGGNDFRESSNLEKVDLGAGLTSSMSWTFYQCKKLKTLIMRATNPPTADANTFSGTGLSSGVIIVPAASMADYAVATNWSTYASRLAPLEDHEDGGYVPIADAEVLSVLVAKGVDKNGSGYMSKNEVEAVTDMTDTFKNNTAITTFDELEQFTNLVSLGTRTDYPSDYGTFLKCTSLVSVKLPSSVKTLGSYCFKDCSSLESVGDLTNIESIGSNIFYNCKKLSMIVDMPNIKQGSSRISFWGSGITGIGNIGQATLGGGWNDGCFQNCTSLKFAILPSSVTNITGYDFSGCSALQTLIMRNESPCTLGSLPTNIVSIYVPDASVDAYKEASGWSTYAAKIKPMSAVTSDALYSEFQQYL